MSKDITSEHHREWRDEQAVAFTLRRMGRESSRARISRIVSPSPAPGRGSGEGSAIPYASSAITSVWRGSPVTSVPLGSSRMSTSVRSPSPSSGR